MALPDPPDWKDLIASPESWQTWVEQHFVASELQGFVICLKCASLVVAGEQKRHDASLHGFKGL